MVIKGTVGTNYTPSIGFVTGDNTHDARGGTKIEASTMLTGVRVENSRVTTVT